MVTETEYKTWLSTGETDKTLIETIELYHSAWGSGYIANWDVPFDGTLTDKGNTVVPFVAGRFYLDTSVTSASLDQRTHLVMSSLKGQIYEELRALTVEQRQEPIRVTPRLYFDDDFSKILMNPPPVWTLHSVTSTVDTVRGDLRSTPLRTHRIGRYYTALEFPVLAFAN